MKTGFSLGCAALLSATALSASHSASASSETVIHNFPANSAVIGQVQEDSAGNLYGTTVAEHHYGTAYRLQQRQSLWRAKNIHVFNGSDGWYLFAGLTLNRTAAALYGVAEHGGTYGAGVIFGLSQTGHRWAYTTLHSFTGADGENPMESLTNDRATGTLYGTASNGGNASCGTAFQLNPTNGQFSVLHTFHGGSDGCNPSTQLREGVKSGTLIGAVAGGHGALFLLTEKGGTWRESILHNFTGGADGDFPIDMTILSSDGTNSIYGVTVGGGLYNYGVVFQLSRPFGKWQYKVIYNFAGGNDGQTPEGIHLDNVTGTLYGTTGGGGAFDRGTLFKLVSSGDKWTKTVLHDFGSGSDGAYPSSRPIVDQQTGLLYGTTYLGGTQNGGTVYSATP